MDSDVSFTSDVFAQWKTQEAPQFTLVINEAMDESDDEDDENLIVRVTNEIRVQIECTNYRTTNQNLQMSY